MNTFILECTNEDIKFVDVIMVANKWALNYYGEEVVTALKDGKREFTFSQLMAIRDVAKHHTLGRSIVEKIDKMCNEPRHTVTLSLYEMKSVEEWYEMASSEQVMFDDDIGIMRKISEPVLSED